MTREEIDRSLRRIGLAIEAGSPEPLGGFAALFVIVRDQEARLRALECKADDDQERRAGPDW